MQGSIGPRPAANAGRARRCISGVRAAGARAADVRVRRREARRPAGIARGHRPPGHRRSSTVSAARTVATGQPVTATSSSTVARPSTSSRPIRPATSPTPTSVAAARLGTPGSARWSARPRSSISCGIPETIRASAGNSRRKARQPADAGAPIGPGTRKQSRPCSSAHDAVIRAPLRAGASTTTVASASPLMIRLRRGNVPMLGSTSGASSDTTAPAGRDDGGRQPAVGARMEDGVTRPDDRDGRAAGMDARRRARRRRCRPRAPRPRSRRPRRAPPRVSTPSRGHRRSPVASRRWPPPVALSRAAGSPRT